MGTQVEIKYKNGESENLYDGLARDFMEQYRLNDYFKNEFIYSSFDNVKIYIKYDEILSVKVVNE